jgi:c-di-GMP-binding flagellar brake protein YcgR
MVASQTFLSHLGATQNRLFSVRWTEGVEVVQRRAYLRMDADCPIEYTVIGSDVTESGLRGSGVTRNISAAGLQFQIEAPTEDTVAVGDLLEIRVSIGNGTVLSDARVVRVEDATDLGPDGRPKPPAKASHRPMTYVAVQFESIREAAQDRIVRHIFYLQRTLQRAKRDNRPGQLRSASARARYSSGARW